MQKLQEAKPKPLWSGKNKLNSVGFLHRWFRRSLRIL